MTARERSVLRHDFRRLLPTGVSRVALSGAVAVRAARSCRAPALLSPPLRYHFIVGEGAENDGVLAALSRATEGACAGSKRRIAISAAALDAPPAPTFDLTADAGGGAAARVLNDATSRPKFAADDAADASGVDAALEIEIVHVTAASDYEIFQLIAAKVTES